MVDSDLKDVLRGEVKDGRGDSGTDGEWWNRESLSPTVPTVTPKGGWRRVWNQETPEESTEVGTRFGFRSRSKGILKLKEVTSSGRLKSL